MNRCSFRHSSYTLYLPEHSKAIVIRTAYPKDTGKLGSHYGGRSHGFDILILYACYVGCSKVCV